MTGTPLGATTVAPSTTLIDLSIDGTAKPKGSLRHVGGGRLVEQVAGSSTWKAIVATHARAARGNRPTYLEAVEVEATVYVTKPKSAPKSRMLPITRSSGDSDKLARNLLDALSDAGVYRDDSQVTDLIIRKRHAGPSGPGVLLTVRTVAA